MISGLILTNLDNEEGQVEKYVSRIEEEKISRICKLSFPETHSIGNSEKYFFFFTLNDEICYVLYMREKNQSNS